MTSLYLGCFLPSFVFLQSQQWRALTGLPRPPCRSTRRRPSSCSPRGGRSPLPRPPLGHCPPPPLRGWAGARAASGDLTGRMRAPAARASPGTEPDRLLCRKTMFEFTLFLKNITEVKVLFSSSGGCYRPTWRPRREALNIDSIFSGQSQRICSKGYHTLPGPSHPPPPPLQPPSPCVRPTTPTPRRSQLTEGREAAEVEARFGLVGQPRTLGRMMGPPAPTPLRGVEHQPRLIQRMESGYESSERNSSSPDR